MDTVIQKFRSALGGFNRQDVQTYIEETAAAHRKELAQLQERLEQAEGRTAELEAALSGAELEKSGAAAEEAKVRSSLEASTKTLSRLRGELKGLLRRSVLLIGGFSAAMCLAGETLGRPLSVIFVGYDPDLLDMTAHAFAIFSVAFLFSGFAIFGSSFFTALNDGLTSALISFLRTLVFQCAAVIIFPILWGLDGIWWSIVAAEVMAVAVTLAFLIGKRKKYGYA